MSHITLAYEGEGFLELILSLTNLSIHDKIGILERTADELFIQGDNLKMLEYKQAIKELKDEAEQTGK